MAKRKKPLTDERRRQVIKYALALAVDHASQSGGELANDIRRVAAELEVGDAMQEAIDFLRSQGVRVEG